MDSLDCGAARVKHFYYSVPDILDYPAGRVEQPLPLPWNPPRPRGRPSIDAAVLSIGLTLHDLNIWRQGSTETTIAVRLIRDIYWGAHPPEHWYPLLARALHFTPGVRPDYLCRTLPWEKLGVMAQFLKDPYDHDDMDIDPRRRGAILGKGNRHTNIRRKLKKQGKLWGYYLPGRLFGPSARIGWGPRQRKLLQAIWSELTRAPYQKDEPPSLLRVPGATCPYLDAWREYNVFGGNCRGRRYAQGYRVFAERGLSWLWKAGYGAIWDSPTCYKQLLAQAAQLFYDDLTMFSKALGLTTALVERHGKVFKPLSAILEKDLLFQQDYRLRIFAPEGFLSQWRGWFAAQLGFDEIPGDQALDEGWTGRRVDTPRVRKFVLPPVFGG